MYYLQFYVQCNRIMEDLLCCQLQNPRSEKLNDQKWENNNMRKLRAKDST